MALKDTPGGGTLAASGVFRITKNNIYFGEEILPLRNIASVAKGVEKNPLRLILGLLGAGVTLSSLAVIQLTYVPLIVGVVLLVAAMFLGPKHGLVITLNSRQQRVLESRDEKWIDALLQTIYVQFEAENQEKALFINMGTQEVHLGDRFENITDSTILNRSGIGR